MVGLPESVVLGTPLLDANVLETRSQLTLLSPNCLSYGPSCSLPKNFWKSGRLFIVYTPTIWSAGRLLDAHERYAGQKFEERWKEIEEKHPEMAADARRELEWLSELQAEAKRDGRLEPDKRLLDGKDEHERFVDKIIEQERELDKERLKSLQEGIGPKREPELDLTKPAGGASC